MITYKYKAQTVNGNITEGIIQGTDEYDAANKVKQVAPILVSLTPVKSADSSSILNMEIGGNKVNLKSLSMMCSQIQITLQSGIQLARCFEMIGRQTEDKMLRKMLLDTSEDVAAGNGVAVSMERNCPKLPPTFIETIRAGEASGNIERSFGEMATFYEKTYKNADKVKQALAYPMFVVGVAIVVLIVVMAFVMPSMMTTFSDLGGDLPTMTKVMMAMSEFFNKYWMGIVAVLLVLFIVYQLYKKTEKGKLNIAKLQLKVGSFGKIRLLNGAAEFANTLSMLLGSGLTLNQAIPITAKTMSNYAQSLEVEGLTEQVESGKRLGDCVQNCQYFPNVLKEMCKIGEETGELDSTLDVIGTFYVNEADTATQKALAKLEPTMLILLSIFAGFIVISIYLPMFTMYNYM